MEFSSTLITKRLLFLFLVFSALYFTKDLLIPLVIGAVLATLFLPLCKWLESKNVPRVVSAMLCLLVLIIIGGAIVLLISWQFTEISDNFYQIRLKVTEGIKQVRDYLSQNLGITAERQLRILNNQPTNIGSLIPQLAGSMLYIITGMALTMAYVVMFLYFRDHLTNFILKLSPPGKKSETENILKSSARISQQYLVGLAKMIACLWVMYGIGFSALGVKNAIFFAILCGLLEIIPYVGNITGTIITLLAASASGAGIGTLWGIVITYSTVQLIQGWLLEPLIVGPQVKINSLFTVIALVVGEMTWGIPGIVLAIPVMAIIRIICDHIDSLRPYGFLIGTINSDKKPNPILTRIKGWFRT